MNYIAHHVSMSAELRSLKSLKDKAARIKKLCENLTLTKICSELHADYQKSLRRYQALLNGMEWCWTTTFGRI